MKKIIVIAAVAAVLALAWFAIGRFRSTQNANANIETETAQNGSLEVTVKAPGVVRSDQSAILTWKTSGSVESVLVAVGEQVNAGQVLATIDRTTLPQAIILAQAEMVNAQRALDNLVNSRTHSAIAQQAVEQAQQALEDARNPALSQAEAEEKVANAQKTLDDAQAAYEILKNPPPQSAIDQAHANLLIAERILNETDRQIARIQKKLAKDKDKYMFFESKELYQQILDALENKRIRDQRKYDDSLQRYNRLLNPVNPNDLAVAEAKLRLAEAEFDQANVELARVGGGVTQADIAVLEAKLADAQLEWQRLEGGVDEREITAAEARLAAAAAAIQQTRIEAPFGGTITAVYTKAGDQVAPGSPAFRLDNLERLQVDSKVSEVDINKIQRGQPVILTFDSVPDKEYNGEVVELPLVGATDNGVVSFNVVIEIKDADQQVRPGMTASATIIVNQLTDALLVPNRSLRILDGARTIYILKDGQITPVPVTLGVSSENYTEVLGGDLQAGDLIILNPPSEGSP
jgi:HlyD family secretion protein